MPDPSARTETLHSSPRVSDAVELVEGQRLGRFVIEATIGAGGMGTVVAARDPDLDRRVAIKVLHAGTGDRVRQHRLLQEARAIARIRHPNVVIVHEIGEHDGRLFVVMELIEGPSLREWLSKTSRTLDEKLAVLVGAARGLAHAHAQGITHRDFKPENLMIDADGAAKVVDFGIADLDSELRDTGFAAAGITQTGEAVGTPPYMAPEQLRGEAVSPACDQFSWCITLYEALVGARPERRPELAAIAAGASPQPIELAAVALPPAIRAVLTRGLAPSAAERFASMDELIATLQPRARRRWPLVIAGGLALGAAIAGGAVAWSGNDAADPCAAGGARIASVWNPVASVRLVASLGVFAPRTVAAIDARAVSWRTSHAAVCTAAPVSARPHRMACLDDALAGMRAFVEFWGARSAEVAPLRAVGGADALADPRACEDAEPPSGTPPRSPAEELLFARLQEASVARSANAWDRSVAIAHAVADEARAINSDRVFARARIISGDGLGFLLKLDEAERELREAVDAAARSKEDRLAADAWGTLIVHVGVHGRRHKEALSLATAARAAVSRLGSGDREAALRLHLDLGRVMSVARDFTGARTELESAVAIVDAPPRQSDKLVGEVHFELAAALMELDERDAGRAHLERALEAQLRAYGDVHPAVAQTLQHLGLDRSERGEHAAALSYLERARAAYEASIGRDHPLTASTHGDMATVLARLGRYDEALVNMQRDAEVMLASYGPKHPIAIESRGRVGKLLLEHGDHAQAIAILEGVVAAGDAADTLYEQLELGRAYLAAQRGADARTTLERVRKLAADLGPPELVADIDAALAHPAKPLDRPAR